MLNPSKTERCIIDSSDDKMEFNQEWYKLSPKQNITLPELAQIISLLEMSIDDSVYKKLEPDLQQHFVKRTG